VVLELGLGVGIALEGRAVGCPRRHLPLEPRESGLDRELGDAAREQILLERSTPLARRSLVVQHRAHALGEGELTTIERIFAREHPQQRRLTGPVAPSDGHPIARFELEGDAAEERLTGHVLGET
jgi:hypothetical protein